MSNITCSFFFASTMLLLSPILMGIDDVSAKNYKKDAKKQLKQAEEWADCTEKNAEKVMFYLNQDPPKFYNQNLFCEPEKQYKYDRLNQLAGIDEYKDAHNFVLSQDFDDDDDNDKKKDKGDKKDKEKNDNDD